jgi:hypothetical protein
MCDWNVFCGRSSGGMNKIFTVSFNLDVRFFVKENKLD